MSNKFKTIFQKISKKQTNVFQSLERDNRALFIVSGYMHKHKTELILDLIKIIAIYYDSGDEWSSIHTGINMEIIAGSNNRKVLKKLTGTHECIFGSEVIKEGIYEWSIRVNKLHYPSNCWHIYIGVINTKKGDMNFIKNTHPERTGCYTFDTTYGRVANESDTKKII
eukprot:227962_1